MNAALNGPRKLLFQAVPKFPGNLGPSKTKKPAVKKVQVELRDRFNHPSLKADGVYGAKTEADRPGASRRSARTRRGSSRSTGRSASGPGSRSWPRA